MFGILLQNHCAFHLKDSSITIWVSQPLFQRKNLAKLVPFATSQCLYYAIKVSFLVPLIKMRLLWLFSTTVTGLECVIFFSTVVLT